MKYSRIIITMGDPGGIGPEIILKSVTRMKRPKSAWVVAGTEAIFRQAAKAANIPFALKTVADPDQALDAGFYLWDFTHSGAAKENRTFTPGRISRENAFLSYGALIAAADAVVDGRAAGIVTAPVNKSCIRLIESDFTGHTDFLAARSHTEKYAMMFVGEKLKVTLVTVHVALKDVSKLITTDLVLEKIRLTNAFLKSHFALDRPRIAVCALNPHGPETGPEENEVIVPAVEAGQLEGVHVFGPFPADLLFYEALQGKYDALISMYHDQALAPFKMVCFEDGVNVTLGLPFVRTSPDHGTAYDIAYRGTADASSMLSAMRLAERLTAFAGSPARPASRSA